MTVLIAGFCNAVLQVSTVCLGLLSFTSLLAIACGQGGVFGMAGQLPPVYTQAIMGGQGLAGLAVSH